MCSWMNVYVNERKNNNKEVEKEGKEGKRYFKKSLLYFM